MNVVESEVFGLPLSADEIDSPVGISDGFLEGFLISDVDRHEEDLTQISRHFIMLDFVGVTSVGDNDLRRIEEKVSSQCSQRRRARGVRVRPWLRTRNGVSLIL